MTADEALKRLKEGNERTIAGESTSPGINQELRDSLTKGQHPFACVITCSDSRVPPELIFDCTAGELFVIRVAGAVQTPEVIGSVEYAVGSLNVNLVVVLAHSSCGAVKAAVSRKPVPEYVASITDRIAPMVTEQQALGYEGDSLVFQVSKQNSHDLRDALCGSKVIQERLDNGLQVLRAYYEMGSGEVVWDFE